MSLINLSVQQVKLATWLQTGNARARGSLGFRSDECTTLHCHCWVARFAVQTPARRRATSMRILTCFNRGFSRDSLRCEICTPLCKHLHEKEPQTVESSISGQVIACSRHKPDKWRKRPLFPVTLMAITDIEGQPWML